ncbi:recQ-mediated genome instability protein 1 [Coemansia biformis]|uniref:RecQ-mediated genome instability protein 1 n=1 Tax=Coemansia biformis TaxID=1286918 RepID=A0A9W7Y5A1_9FUNG|nr:recQ-mediated genome instability protein 1 [Coemansia biformis]
MFDQAGIAAAIKSKYGAQVRQPWLEQCVAHIDTELGAAGGPGSESRLQLEAQVRLVLEQLVSSEIGDSCYPVLRVDAGSGCVCGLPAGAGVLLQVQEIMDVGVSKHAMWEAVREMEDYEQRGIRPSYLPELDDGEGGGVFTVSGTQHGGPQAAGTDGDQEGERKPKIPRGMLKLVLTDGQTRLAALETEPIPQLDVGLPIGTKVLVSSGQLLAPTGVLCMESTGIQVLGGAPAQYQQCTLRRRLETVLRGGPGAQT